MFRWIRSCFSHDILVELSEKRIQARVFSSSFGFDDIPLIAIERIKNQDVIRAIGQDCANFSGSNIQVVNPFSHPRMLVANFVYAEKILQHAVKTLHQGWFRPAPRMLIHQLEKTAGGLTDIEIRVLRELALGAGAREVFIYCGKTINPTLSRLDDFLAPQNLL